MNLLTDDGLGFSFVYLQWLGLVVDEEVAPWGGLEAELLLKSDSNAGRRHAKKMYACLLLAG